MSETHVKRAFLSLTLRAVSMGRVVRRRAKQPIAALQNEALNRRSRVRVCFQSFQSFGEQFFQRIWKPSVGKTMMFNRRSKRRCANVRKKTKFSFQKFLQWRGETFRKAEMLSQTVPSARGLPRFAEREISAFSATKIPPVSSPLPLWRSVGNFSLRLAAEILHCPRFI